MLLNTLLLPIRHYVFNWQAKQEQLERELTTRLAEVPRERIVEQAPLHVVVPAIQAWSYSIECDEIRDLYANLLASAMTIDSQASVHPGFIEVIKQLHPYEAKLFALIASTEAYPLIELRCVRKSSILKRIIGLREEDKYIPLGRHYTVVKIADKNEVPMPAYWQNLERLGLITIQYDRGIADDERYSRIIAILHCEKHRNSIFGEVRRLEGMQEKGHETIYKRGIAQITPYGSLFAEVCLRGLDNSHNCEICP